VSSGDTFCWDEEGFVLGFCLQNLLEEERERRSEVLSSPSICKYKQGKQSEQKQPQQANADKGWLGVGLWSPTVIPLPMPLTIIPLFMFISPDVSCEI
jgi:hypothetical protein